MSERRDNERLLSDILAEDSPAGQREALLADTLSQVRRRRRFRQAQRGACAITVLAVAGLVFLRHGPPTNSPPSPTKPYFLIQTLPLRTTAIVESRQLPPANLVSSTPTTAVVSTVASAEHARDLNDQDLLALTAPNPAVLVRKGPGSAELVFVSSVSANAGSEN